MKSHFNELIETVLQSDSFPESAKFQAVYIIIDTIISIMYGVNTEDEIKRHLNDLENRVNCDELYPILGTSFKSNKIDSLLIHGTAVVSNELDEGNTLAKGHPSAHILPALIVTAYQNNSSVDEIIEAYIKSYEISSRIAYATNMNDNYHPHGTWGNIGGAVARALLENKSVEEIKKIVLLTMSLPIATSWIAAEKGQKVRNLYTGIGSVIAYESVDLSDYGFSSNFEVVENLWGELLSNSIDSIKLTKGLLKPYMVELNYMKIYPFCRFTHAAIDATKSITTTTKLDINKIKEIQIDTYSLAARCDTQSPGNGLQSKFSIPYAVACTLLNLDIFNEYEVNMSNTKNLTKKITVKSDHNLTSLLPTQRAARVEIIMDNDEIYSEIIYNAKGEFSNKFSEKELWSKYENMLSKYYSDEHIQLLKNNLFDISEFHYFKDWLLYNGIIQEES